MAMVKTCSGRQVMQASSYVLSGALLLLPSGLAQGEVLKLKCVDAHDVMVVQYVIDTDRARVSQIVVGGRLTYPMVVSVTDRAVRFVDLSGEARLDNQLDRATGELVSEVMEGPERGISAYLSCQRTGE
jgi:hypothetical protein